MKFTSMFFKASAVYLRDLSQRYDKIDKITSTFIEQFKAWDINKI